MCNIGSELRLIIYMISGITTFLQEHEATTENEKDTIESSNNEEFSMYSTFYKVKRALAFMSPVYAAYTLSYAMWYVAYFVPYVFLPAAAIEHGLSTEQAVFIASSVGVGSIVGKVGYGFIGDLKKVDSTVLHIIAIFAFGTLTLAFNFTTSFLASLAVSFSIGLSAGVGDGAHTVIVYLISGKKNFSIALGLLYFILSFSTLVGGPIAGWIADSFGRYDEAFYISSGLCYMSAIIAVYALYRKIKMAKSKENKHDISLTIEQPIKTETIKTICTKF